MFNETIGFVWQNRGTNTWKMIKIWSIVDTLENFHFGLEIGIQSRNVNKESFWFSRRNKVRGNQKTEPMIENESMIVWNLNCFGIRTAVVVSLQTKHLFKRTEEVIAKLSSTSWSDHFQKFFCKKITPSMEREKEGIEYNWIDTDPKPRDKQKYGFNFLSKQKKNWKTPRWWWWLC